LITIADFGADFFAVAVAIWVSAFYSVSRMSLVADSVFPKCSR
jgi:hypothetical protein